MGQKKWNEGMRISGYKLLHWKSS